MGKLIIRFKTLCILPQLTHPTDITKGGTHKIPMNHTSLSIAVHHPLVSIEKGLERLLRLDTTVGALCGVLRAARDDLQSEHIICAFRSVRQQFL